MYDESVNCLYNSRAFCQKRVKQHNLRPGPNEDESELHTKAKEAFSYWVLSEKVRHGPEIKQET